MKKLIKSIVTALLIMSVFPTQMYANTAPVEAVSMHIEDAKAEVMIKRLNEINDMDKSSMTRLEKKALRKEVKEIQKTMGSGNGGVYISLGALLIIILLLILIF
jgi:hypothetical protein